MLGCELSVKYSVHHVTLPTAIRNIGIHNPSKMTDIKPFKATPVWWMVFIFIWLVLLRLPDQMPSLHLDVSWASALSYFAAQQRQFGSEVIFTFGPLGYLYPDVYAGYVFESKVVFELLIKALFAGLLVNVIKRSSKVLGALIICAILLYSPSSMDYLFFFAITYGLVLVSRMEKALWPAVAASIVLGFFSLIKFSFLIPAVIGLLTLSANWGFALKWREISISLLSYLSTLVSAWIIAGQDLSGLAPYLQTGLYVSLSYTSAMFKEAALATETVGMATLLVVGLTLVAANLYSRMAQPHVINTLLLGQGLFFSWKYGFVRADAHHIPHYFLYCQLLIATTWDISRPTCLSKRTFFNLTILGYFATYLGLAMTHTPDANQAPNWKRAIYNADVLFNMPAYRLKLERQLTATKALYPLPIVKKHIGAQTVDVFGYEQGVALLNDLNYYPRPAFQSYATHHPLLLRANETFYRSDIAPQFVLFKLQTIDNRIPAADDSLALEAIFSNYKPIISEQDYVLWKKNESTRRRSPSRLVKSGTASFGESVAVPSANRRNWLAVEWDYSWPGKIVELVYKPSEVRIEITTDTGEIVDYRLVRPLAATAFSVNPLLRNTNDASDFVQGKTVRRAVSFRVVVSSRLYIPRFRYRLFANDDSLTPESIKTNGNR